MISLKTLKLKMYDKIGKLQEKKRKHTKFEFDILSTSVKNIVSYFQCEKMD